MKKKRGVGGRMSSKDRKSPARRRRRQRRRTMTTGARIGGFGHWARNSWTTVGGGGEPRETQPKYHRKKCVRTSFISQFYSSESVSLDRVCSPQRPAACMLGVIVTEQGRSARRQPSASHLAQQLLPDFIKSREDTYREQVARRKDNNMANRTDKETKPDQELIAWFKL